MYIFGIRARTGRTLPMNFAAEIPPHFRPCPPLKSRRVCSLTRNFLYHCTGTLRPSPFPARSPAHLAANSRHGGGVRGSKSSRSSSIISFRVLPYIRISAP